MEQSLKRGCDFYHVQSFLTPSSSKKAPLLLDEDKTKRNHKSRQTSWSVTWQWSRMRSRMRKGIRRRKVIASVRRMSINGNNKKTIPKSSCSNDHVCSSKENSRGLQEDICNSQVTSAYVSRHDSQHNNKDQKSCSKDECYYITSLSQKYQPKLFEEIVGHEVIMKAISKSAEKKKVAHLYLFYGSSGNGKTSTARIFAMALQCESFSSYKPCQSCRGCSRSLYIMDLCSGSRTTSFQRISSLLQNTSFTEAVPGFKVFIIDECHLLTAEEWEELLRIVEGSHGFPLVFVLTTGDTTMIPQTISSRCQKFRFPKLKDMDVKLKLARIITHEEIEVEREALQLIVAKADGSLREAENILDQLTLLGATITSSMVQQIVGLAPQDKLINLLTTVLSGDTKGTIIATRKLIDTGVEAQAIVSQLVSLITNILSSTVIFTPNSPSTTGPSKDNGLFNIPHSSFAGPSNDNKVLNSGSQLLNKESEGLCQALKILIKTEKQHKCSISQTTWILEALLQIAIQNVSDKTSLGTVMSRDILLPFGKSSIATSEHIQCHKPSHRGSWIPHSSNNMDTIRSRDMEEIWLNMLENMQSKYMQEFLHRQAKLASLTISNDRVIAHLMFKRHEDKLAAQVSEESISKALKNAIGCPVTINMSLEPVDLEFIEDTITSNKSLTAKCGWSGQQESTPSPREFVYPKATMPGSTHQIPSYIRLKDSTSISQDHERYPTELHGSKTWPQQRLPFSGVLLEENNLGATANPRSKSLERNQFPVDNDHIRTTNKTKHRWLSLSSIQHSDASVEPYSQDILFENATKEKDSGARKSLKLQRGSFKPCENHHLQDTSKSIGLNRSWSCKDILCQKKPKVRNMQHKQNC